MRQHCGCERQDNIRTPHVAHGATSSKKPFPPLLLLQSFHLRTGSNGAPSIALGFNNNPASATHGHSPSYLVIPLGIGVSHISTHFPSIHSTLAYNLSPAFSPLSTSHSLMFLDAYTLLSISTFPSPIPHTPSSSSAPQLAFSSSRLDFNHLFAAFLRS